MASKLLPNVAWASLLLPLSHSIVLFPFIPTRGLFLGLHMGRWHINIISRSTLLYIMDRDSWCFWCWHICKGIITTIMSHFLCNFRGCMPGCEDVTHLFPRA